MKQTNIPIVLVSVIACLLLVAVLGGSVFLIAYHIKYKEAPTAPVNNNTTTVAPSETPTPAPSTESPTEPKHSETPSPSIGTPSPTETPAQTETPEITGSFVLAKTGDAGQAYIDSLTFFGDSTTYHLKKNGLLTDGVDTTQVWYGKNGALSLPYAVSNMLFSSTADENANSGKLLSALAAEKKPAVLVVTLGVGVSNMFDEDDFKLAYNTVIETVLSASPSTKIICQSIYPVTRATETTTALNNGINNDDIRKCNRWIADCVRAKNDGGENVFYLDSFTLLVGADGYLPNAYSNGDGLHLSNAAYELILENLRNHKIPD